MKKLIREDAHATLWYHPDGNVVHHKIHKFLPAGTLREILTAGADCLESNKATKWLSDDRQNPVLNKDDAEWGRTVWARRAVTAGLKYWAIVLPAQMVGQMQMAGLMADFAAMGLTVQVFEDDAAALEWLSSVDRRA